MIITFATQKGGTGKTTLAIAFANYLSGISERKLNVFDFEYLDIAIERAIDLYKQNAAFRLYKVKAHILKFELDLAEEELDRIEHEFEPTPEFYMEKVYLSNILKKYSI